MIHDISEISHVLVQDSKTHFVSSVVWGSRQIMLRFLRSSWCLYQWELNVQWMCKINVKWHVVYRCLHKLPSIVMYSLHMSRYEWYGWYKLQPCTYYSVTRRLMARLPHVNTRTVAQSYGQCQGYWRRGALAQVELILSSGREGAKKPGVPIFPIYSLFK